MAYDLGDPVPLSIQIKDSSGTLANATLVTLYVTGPDGSTTSATITPTTTGVYQQTYAPSTAGRYIVRWAATGTNASAYTDTFDVMPADVGYLCSLADLRDELNLTSSNTVHDDELRLYLAAATPIIEDLTGPMLPATVTEQYDGGTQNIILRHNPINTVTTVVEYWGSYAFTLTQASNPANAGQYSYTVDVGTGVITRRTPSGAATFFATGLRNIHVTYTVGNGTVPANVRLAARRLAAHSYRVSQQGTRPAFGTGDTDQAFTPSGFAVPRSVLELVKPNRRPPGIA
jgi:hypothetical protein